MNTEERTARTSSQEYSQPIQHNEETADSTNIDDANVDHDYDEPPEDNETIPPTTFQKNNNKKSGNKLNRIRSSRKVLFLTTTLFILFTFSLPS